MTVDGAESAGTLDFGISSAVDCSKGVTRAVVSFGLRVKVTKITELTKENSQQHRSPLLFGRWRLAVREPDLVQVIASIFQ